MPAHLQGRRQILDGIPGFPHGQARDPVLLHEEFLGLDELRDGHLRERGLHPFPYRFAAPSDLARSDARIGRGGAQVKPVTQHHRSDPHGKTILIGSIEEL